MNTKALAPIDEVRTALGKMADQFKMALPSNVTPEKFTRVLITSLQNNPKLLECNRQTLYSAAMKCAQDGLIPDGREAALTQFKGSVQYMPMVGGICKKARNSGEIGTIDAQVVHEKDSYESWTDEKGPHFKHVRARKDRGDAILVYAYAIAKDGFLYFEELAKEDVDAVEKMSHAKDGPWKGPFKLEMWRKTALRRLAKYRLPSSSDLDDVIRRDDEMYAEEEPAPPPEKKTKSSRLSKIVGDDVEDAQTVPNKSAAPSEEPPPPTDPHGDIPL